MYCLFMFGYHNPEKLVFIRKDRLVINIYNIKKHKANKDILPLRHSHHLNY